MKSNYKELLKRAHSQLPPEFSEQKRFEDLPGCSEDLPTAERNV